MVMVILNGFYIKFKDISFFPHRFSTIFRVRNVFTTPKGHGHGHGYGCEVYGQKTGVYGKKIEVYGMKTELYGKKTDVYGKKTGVYGKKTDVYGKKNRRLQGENQGRHPQTPAHQWIIY